MYTLVDQLEILYITNLEWCLQQLAFAVVDVVHCILEQKERLQMLHSFLEIFSKGKNFPVPDTYVKGREFWPKAPKARFNIVGLEGIPPAAATVCSLSLCAVRLSPTIPPSNSPQTYYLLYFTISLQKIPSPITPLQPFPSYLFPLYTITH